VAELETRLRDHLRTALGERHLEFAERPIRLTGGFDTQIFAFRLAAALAALAGVEQAARVGENLMPRIIAAVEVYATLGEIADRMRAVFGEYREAM